MLATSGCQALQSLQQQPEQVEAIGESAQQLGTQVSLIRPELGLAVIVLGGALAGIGKALKKKEEE